MDLKPLETAQKLIDTAFHRASKEATAGKLPREREMRAKAIELKKIEIVGGYLTERLNGYVKDVPTLDELHPFYKALMEVTIDVNSYKTALGHVTKVSQLVNKLRRDLSRKVYASKNEPAAYAARKQFYARVDSMVKSLDASLLLLEETRKKLREMPEVRFDVPTVILAGYPNTGKSTLLKRLTTSAPEIAAYPFTTKGIKLGYYSRKHMNIQVADTPGLLDRPITERNNIEKKALAALQHLAEVIVYIIDPTDRCGYTLDKQLSLLKEVRLQFNKPVLVVANKVDVATPAQLEAAKAAGEIILEGEGVASPLREAIYAAIDWKKYEKAFGSGPFTVPAALVRNEMAPSWGKGPAARKP